MSEQVQGLRPYKSHGLDIRSEKGSDQSRADCIFCEAEGKFYINNETGLFDCKVCGLKGNHYNFIRELYKCSVDATTDEDYKELAKDRGLLKSTTPKIWGFARSIITGEWLYPGYYGSHHLDKIKNLYIYKSYEGKMRLFSSAGFKQCMFNVQNYNPAHETVYITEGCWDGMALWEIMSISKWNNEGGLDYTGNIDHSLLQNGNVLCVPSVNIFDEEWAKFFNNKRVIILPQNDYPKKNKASGRIMKPNGQQMVERIIGVLSQMDKPPREVNYLQWDEINNTYNLDLKDGYDIRDELNKGKNFEQRGKIITTLLKRIKPVPSTWISESSEHFKDGKLTLDTIPCSKYSEVVDAWKKAVVFHPSMEKTLACMLAAVASTMLEDDQLWLRIIAPPSSGKTILCDAICTNRKYAIQQSHIRGFFSGMRPREDENGNKEKSDYGMIMEILNKAFVTKDGDTLLRAVNHDQIMAEAREIYDGETKTHFKNNMGKLYKDIRTVWILCGTESLRGLDTSELGERFVTIIALDKITAELELSMARYALSSMNKSISFKKPKSKYDVANEEENKTDETKEDKEKVVVKSLTDMQKAKRLTGGYVSYIRSQLMEQKIEKIFRTITPKLEDEIVTHGYLVSYMRSRPSKKQEEKANKELCTRLSKQFNKLAGCLAGIMQKDTVDDEVMKIVKTVAFDSSAGTIFDVTKLLYLNFLQKGLPYESYTKTGGIGFNQLKEILKQKEDRMNDLLRYMRRIKVARQITIKDNKSVYVLTSELINICHKVFKRDRKLVESMLD